MRTPNVYMTDKFRDWLLGLKDIKAKSAIHARIGRLGYGLFGDCKRIGNISELRVNVGPGYRVYFTMRGSDIILLLVGGDKSSQDRDIKLAKKLAEEETIPALQGV